MGTKVIGKEDFTARVKQIQDITKGIEADESEE